MEASGYNWNLSYKIVFFRPVFHKIVYAEFLLYFIYLVFKLCVLRLAYYYMKICISLHRSLTPPRLQQLSQVRISNVMCRGTFLCSMVLGVDIGGIVDHRCLNFLFVMQQNLKQIKLLFIIFIPFINLAVILSFMQSVIFGVIQSLGRCIETFSLYAFRTHVYLMSSYLSNS